MKRFIFFAHVCTWFAFTYPTALCAQHVELSFPSYVVIGAFAYEQNAVHFTNEARSNKFPAVFKMNPNRNLYYVYVLSTADKEYAVAEALKLRAETKYFDTWVYSGVLGKMDPAALQQGGHQDVDPVTGQKITRIHSEEEQNSTVSTLPHREAKRTGQQGNEKWSDIDPSGSEIQRKDQPADNPILQQQASANNTKKATTSTRRKDEQSTNVNAQQTALTPSTSPQRSQSSAPQGQGTNQTRSNDPETAGQPPVPNEQKTKSNVRQHQRPGQAQKENGADVNMAAGDKTDSASRQDQLAGKSNGLPAQSTDSKVSSTKQNHTSGEAGTEENKILAAGKENLSQSSQRTAMPTEEASVPIPPPVRQTTIPLSSEEVEGKNFYFHLFRADNLNTVPGEVEAIDFEKSRKMATYSANEGVKVIMPSGKTKHISFVCQVFGYRKQQQEFDPESPSEALYLDDKGNLVIPFELMRLQKGDIAIMYNVFFFKDAAVMRPESRYEVNNLLDLLKENPSYKILIHGHTNGNASGKILRMDKTGNFYSLSGTKQGFGSARKLSGERAMLIREFLISSGVSPDRMNVKAWGGKKPIHDKHSARAHENVRVEIEILSE